MKKYKHKVFKLPKVMNRINIKVLFGAYNKKTKALEVKLSGVAALKRPWPYRIQFGSAGSTTSLLAAVSLTVSSARSSSSCCLRSVFCSSNEVRSFSNCCSSSCGDQSHNVYSGVKQSINALLSKCPNGRLLCILS